MSQSTPLVISTRGQKQKARTEAKIEADKNDAKQPQNFKSKEPIVHPVPDDAMFTMIKLAPGARNKVEKEVHLSYIWDVEFEEILAKLDATSGFLASKKPAGAWEVTRTIGLVEEGKKSHPNSRFEVDLDWDVWKTKYLTRVAQTGKSWCFVVQCSFSAMSASFHTAREPSSTPTLSDSIMDLTNSPTPNSTPFSRSSTSAGRQSTTSIRLGQLSDAELDLSQVISKIQTANQCVHCKPGHCFIVVEGLPHLQLSHGCVSAWAKDVMIGKASIEKLPDWYPEYREWKLKYTKSDTKNNKTSIAHNSMGMNPFAYPWPPAWIAPPRGPEYAQGYLENNQLPELQSSPPPSGASQYELLLQWMDFTIKRHAECAELDVYQIVSRCKSESMGMQAIREILSKKDNSQWREVADYGINRGLARAMHLSLTAWQAYRKAHPELN